MGGLAAAAGPSVGGLLVDAFNWRAVFLINVPIVVLISVVGPRWLSESRAEGIPDSVDLISVPLAALGVGAFILAIVQGGDWGWTSAPVIGCLLGGAALVAVTPVSRSVLAQGRAHQPDLVAVPDLEDSIVYSRTSGEGAVNYGVE